MKRRVEKVVVDSWTSCEMEWGGVPHSISLDGDEAAVLWHLACRLAAGRDRYGKFDAATDKRDFRQELFEEVLDAMNYCAMGLVKEEK